MHWGLTMLLPVNLPDTNDLELREDLRQLLEQQAAAWNRGDLEGFMAGYWQSPELTLSSGRESFRGWQSTLDRYRRIYQNDGRHMGRLTLSELEIEALGPDSAFVRGRWQMLADEEILTGLFTLICRRLADGWRIVHDHTSA